MGVDIWAGDLGHLETWILGVLTWRPGVWSAEKLDIRSLRYSFFALPGLRAGFLVSG